MICFIKHLGSFLKRIGESEKAGKPVKSCHEKGSTKQANRFFSSGALPTAKWTRQELWEDVPHRTQVPKGEKRWLSLGSRPTTCGRITPVKAQLDNRSANYWSFAPPFQTGHFSMPHAARSWALEARSGRVGIWEGRRWPYRKDATDLRYLLFLDVWVYLIFGVFLILLNFLCFSRSPIFVVGQSIAGFTNFHNHMNFGVPYCYGSKLGTHRLFFIFTCEAEQKVFVTVFVFSWTAGKLSQCCRCSRLKAFFNSAWG